MAEYPADNTQQQKRTLRKREFDVISNYVYFHQTLPVMKTKIDEFRNTMSSAEQGLNFVTDFMKLALQIKEMFVDINEWCENVNIVDSDKSCTLFKLNGEYENIYKAYVYNEHVKKFVDELMSWSVHIVAERYGHLNFHSNIPINCSGKLDCSNARIELYYRNK